METFRASSELAKVNQQDVPGYGYGTPAPQGFKSKMSSLEIVEDSSGFNITLHLQ